jgi:hypothetical protein
VEGGQEVEEAGGLGGQCRLTRRLEESVRSQVTGMVVYQASEGVGGVVAGIGEEDQRSGTIWIPG